jgi:RNA polymerase sigma-54 factor
LELKQQLKMSQQLVMTPQLQQAIKLLQMSRMELVETVHQELLENPVLEDVRELVDPGAAVNGADANTASIESNGVGEKKLDESARDADKKASEIDWDRYIENHAMQAPMPGGIYRGSGDELPSLEATLTKTEDLVDHIEWQIRMSDLVEDERRFAALVVGNLDDRGNLTIEGVAPEDVVPRLAAEAEIDPEDADEV